MAMTPVPAIGVIAGGVHRFPLRVYFEDTDLSGVVYHANYLRYMERARSDLLERIGVDQRAAFDAGIGVYAVADLCIRYVTPARLGDTLIVETRLTALGGASVTMDQRIMRGESPVVDATDQKFVASATGLQLVASATGLQLVASATVRAGWLSISSGRPQRQPADWVARFADLLAVPG